MEQKRRDCRKGKPTAHAALCRAASLYKIMRGCIRWVNWHGMAWHGGTLYKGKVQGRVGGWVGGRAGRAATHTARRKAGASARCPASCAAPAGSSQQLNDMRPGRHPPAGVAGGLFKDRCCTSWSLPHQGPSQLSHGGPLAPPSQWGAPMRRGFPPPLPWGCWAGAWSALRRSPWYGQGGSGWGGGQTGKLCHTPAQLCKPAGRPQPCADSPAKPAQPAQASAPQAPTPGRLT